MRRSDRGIKAVEQFFKKKMTAEGEMEPGQAAIRKAISEIRRAKRSRDSDRLWYAVERLAHLFLRSRAEQRHNDES